MCKVTFSRIQVRKISFKLEFFDKNKVRKSKVKVDEIKNKQEIFGVIKANGIFLLLKANGYFLLLKANVFLL